MSADKGPSPLRLELSEDERETLLRILKKHRRTIPGYLQSRHHELQLVDDLIDRLS